MKASSVGGWVLRARGRNAAAPAALERLKRRIERQADRWRSRPTAQARLHRDRRARRHRPPRPWRRLRGAEARRPAAALRFPARDRRRARELGRHPRAEPRARREAARRPRRGPSARLRRLRGPIGKGEYGGGEVIVWDRGRWQPKGDPVRGMKKGQLDFTLQGEKLKGAGTSSAWPKPRREARELAADQGQRRRGRARAPDPDILEEAPASVISGRTIEDIAAGRPASPAETSGARPPRRSRRRRRPTPSRASSRRRSRRCGQAADRRALGPRDQVRRLPAAGADPRRQGAAADPQRPGLDATASARRFRRARSAPLRERDPRRRAGGRERGGPPTSPRCRPTSPPGGATASGSTCSMLLYLDGADLRARR